MRKTSFPCQKRYKKIAVIGPNADNFEALIGNYNGIPKDAVTVLKGISVTRFIPTQKLSMQKAVTWPMEIHNLTPIPSRYLQTADGRQGALGEYLDNREMEGVLSSHVLTIRSISTGRIFHLAV